MKKFLINLAATQLGKWILGGLVALLLGGGGLWWHNTKQALRGEGLQECVQEINQATLDGLQVQLAANKAANARLAAELRAVAEENQAKNARIAESATRLETLEQQMEAQRNEDESYSTWSDTTIPDGVVDRLRQASGSASDNGN